MGHENHTNYVKIWAILLVLLVISVLGPLLEIQALTLITAFGIAIVKALIVATYFMHLNIEKKVIWYMLIAGLVFLLVFFAGLAPDVLNSKGQNWSKLYQEPVIEEHHGSEQHHAPEDHAPAHEASH